MQKLAQDAGGLEQMRTERFLRWLVAGCVILSLLIACSADRTTVVSIVNLISDADSFDKKHVRVYGYARIAEENTALYLTKASGEYAIVSQGVWLNLDYTAGKEISDWRHLDREWVIVEGEFRSEDKGHFGLFAGSISNIKTFEVLVPGTASNN